MKGGGELVRLSPLLLTLALIKAGVHACGNLDKACGLPMIWRFSKGVLDCQTFLQADRYLPPDCAGHRCFEKTIEPAEFRQ